MKSNLAIVKKIDRGFDEFEAQKLREPKQLPEIDEDSFTLVWDFVADKTYENDRTVLSCSTPPVPSRQQRPWNNQVSLPMTIGY
jgi:hypothetical protein